MDTMTIFLFVIGLVALIGGAEMLVRGASRLAIIVGISPLVVGLTVVSYGTSAPELAVSVQSSFAGQPDMAIGNVVGSNIANILLILGLSAVITPLVVSLQLIRFDVPLMIGASILLLVIGMDGKIGRLDGILLFLGAIAYTTWLIYQSRKETQAQRQAENARSAENAENKAEEAPPPASMLMVWARSILLIGAGLGLLIVGSRWLVDGAVAFATLLGMSEFIISLTIVAAGTSLPEVATSAIASMRGERDIAVGNVVGSNIFNILSVLGLAAVVAPEGIPVGQDALHFDIPIMIVVAIACLPIFFTGHMIARWEGALFLGYYLAYTTYLILRGTSHIALPLFSTFLGFFALPLTAITLLILVARCVRKPCTERST